MAGYLGSLLIQTNLVGNQTGIFKAGCAYWLLPANVSCATTVRAMEGSFSKPQRKRLKLLIPVPVFPIDGNSPQSRAKTCPSELPRNPHTAGNSKSLLEHKLSQSCRQSEASRRRRGVLGLTLPGLFAVQAGQCSRSSR